MADENNNIEEQQTEAPVKGRQQPKKRSMGRWIIGSLLYVLLLLGLPLALYIPAVQDFVCRRVVEWLNTSSEALEYRVGYVRLDFPLKLRVGDVAVLDRQHGDTLVSVGSMRTGLDDIPINQPYFVLNNLELDDVTVGMDSLTQSMGVSGSLQALQVKGIELDIDHSQLRIASVSATQPDLRLYLGPSAEKEADEEPAGWAIKVGSASIRDGFLALRISDESLTAARMSEAQTPYLDYTHLDLNGIGIEVENVQYEDNLIRADLRHVEAHEEHSALAIKQLAARFKIQGPQIAAEDIDLQLDGMGEVQGDLLLHLGLFDTIRTGFADVHLRAALDSSNLISIVAPYVESLPQHWVNATTELSLDARLTPDSLDLRNLEAAVAGHSHLKAEAFATAPFDDDNRVMNATLKADLKHSDFLLTAFVAPKRERICQLPESLAIDLEATQRDKRFTVRAGLQQQLRQMLNVDATYDLGTDSYHLSAATQGLKVSDFVPGEPYDELSLRVVADGRHFQFPGKWTRLEANVQLDSLGYRLADGKRETLEGFDAEVSLLGGNYVAQVHSQHPTAQFETHLEGLFQKDTLTAAGYLNVPQIDLAHLPGGMSMPDLGKLSFRSLLTLAYNWGDVAEAGIHIDSLRYKDDKIQQDFDNILMTLESRPGMLYADITGGDAYLCLNTERGISEFPQIVTTFGNEVNRQLDSLRFNFNALQDALPQGQLDFHMAQDNPFYAAINHFGYQFNSIDMAAYNLFDLNLDACIVGLRSDDRTVDYDSIIAEVRPCQYLQKGDSLANQRGYRLNVHALHVDPKARDTYDIHAHGLLMPDSVMMDVKYMDGNYVILYDAAASLAIGNDTVTLRLEKNPVLYAQPFTVNADNYISLMEYRNANEHQRTNTSAKVLMKGPRDMALDIYTRKAKNRDIGNQMLVRLQNFDLDYASKTVKWDGDVGGRLNLTAMADLYPDSLGGQLRAGIKAFHLGEYKADTLAFDGHMQMAPDQRDVEGTLTIEEVVKLQLAAALADTVNLSVGVTELPLPLVNLFMPSNIYLDGTTTGQLTMRGKTFEQARMDAFVTMNDAKVGITDMDGLLTLPADTIRIRNNRLSIQDYRILGVNQQPITLRGTVDMRQGFDNPTIDLRISADNVWVADSHRLRLPEQYIYGRLPISTDIRVKGSLAVMDVTGKLQVLSGTDLKFFLQDDPLQSTSRVDQLVEFVSFRQMDRELAHSAIRPLVSDASEGFAMELKIDIDRDVKVDAYLPGEDNNHVVIVGGGPLVMQCAADGSLTMSGAYDVKGGAVDYKLPVLPMTKRFDILSTSLVNWNGVDPGNPTIDIQASENVRATVNDNDGSRLVQFVVTISITGTLDALDMHFTCSAPDDGTVNTEIEAMTDEERSKTALMLLVAQTYMGSGNNSTMGMGTANAALNSVLNRQMDQMLGSALKNTDFDLGIDTYNTEVGAARTDYSIKVSQRLFNDRFHATVGGRVSSGGDPAMGSGASLSDMSLEWLIKKDGTHYLKIYRRRNYQSVLEGEVLESGLVYTQERTAYKFKHLLIPTSQSRQERILKAIREMQRAAEEAERRLIETEDEE